MAKSSERRKKLQCTIHPLETLGHYKYVVVCSPYEGKWLLSRHKNRNTWETQGGHIEPGESPMQAAKRELYEESGVQVARLYPVYDYYGFDEWSHSNGMVFLAVIRHLGILSESEMKETALFETIPDALTYPNVSPILFAESKKALVDLPKE